MTKHISSSRRSFLKGGALLAAPIAAATVTAVAFADDGLKARVSLLEDEAAIRQLHQSWLRQVNVGERTVPLDNAVRRITPHHAGAPDRFEIAADRQSAVGYFDHAVELETPLAPDSTLAKMAHFQGNGTVRRIERRMLRVDYLRSGGSWRIGKVELRTT